MTLLQGIACNSIHFNQAVLIILHMRRLNDNNQIKITDFGLSEDVYSSNYFQQSNTEAKLPVKWMALESMTLGIFSEKSDVV